VSEDQVLIFSERKSKLKGFQLEKTATREYEDGPAFSSVLGYTGKITAEGVNTAALAGETA